LAENVLAYCDVTIKKNFGPPSGHPRFFTGNT